MSKNKGFADGATGRVALINEVYGKALTATESFRYDDLGCELAYLFAAIASGGISDGVEWGEASHAYHIELFRSLFPADHKVWAFIEITTGGAMIHPKSSYVVEDSRHMYGPGREVNGQATVRVGDKAGTWAAFYEYGGLFTLVGFAWGSPPATLAVPFITRGEVLKHCFEQERDVA